MVTPDIHWSVHLDLVTGPPEKADDDEIQCLGKILLDSLERSQILAVLPVGPHPWYPAESHSPSRSRPGTRELEGLELAFHRCVAMVPREVVSSDRPRGGSPPQRI